MERIDAVGLACPKPVMLAKAAIDAGAGELEVAVDNQTATENLSNLARRLGYTAEVTEPEPERFLVTLARNGEAAGAAAPAATAIAAEPAPTAAAAPTAAPTTAAAPTAAPTTAPAPGLAQVQPGLGSHVVFVGKRCVGAGDEQLGYNLLKMAIYVLAAADEAPAALLFMNDGVKLPAGDDEDVLNDLRKLVERGSEVLVCGTCLNHYGLAEGLKVGTVSNMYDILGRMQQASQTITL
ncbi:MAG: sulfurtransferase-like selenium metabolism protein YedF [Coriobacteriales bacterium]|jgi:selenium metabolism protein YedF|nr:sulfurtransferase-like selenium metabolism protein YedF [Coriobacteriales bacterium]